MQDIFYCIVGLITVIGFYNNSLLVCYKWGRSDTGIFTLILALILSNIPYICAYIYCLDGLHIM